MLSWKRGSVTRHGPTSKTREDHNRQETLGDLGTADDRCCGVRRVAEQLG